MSNKIFKGWMAKIFIQGLEVGCCSGVTIDYSSPLEPYYQIDTPDVIPFTEGNLGLTELSGSIKRLWANTYYLKLLFGGETPQIPTEFDMTIYSDMESDSPKFTLYNCRFRKGTLNISASGWTEESFDFIALTGKPEAHIMIVDIDVWMLPFNQMLPWVRRLGYGFSTNSNIIFERMLTGSYSTNSVGGS